MIQKISSLVQYILKPKWTSTSLTTNEQNFIDFESGELKIQMESTPNYTVNMAIKMEAVKKQDRSSCCSSSQGKNPTSNNKISMVKQSKKLVEIFYLKV